MMSGNYSLPVNLGNPDEYQVKDFAVLIKELTKSNSTIKMLPATKDDPKQRRPDITTAKMQLGWEPRVPVREGLAKAIAYFSKELAASGEIVPTGPDASKPQKKHHVDTASLSTGQLVAGNAVALGLGTVKDEKEREKKESGNNPPPTESPKRLLSEQS